jgi:hypothetical protein
VTQLFTQEVEGNPVFPTDSTLEFKYACSLSDIQGKPCYGVIEADDAACNPA